MFLSSACRCADERDRWRYLGFAPAMMCESYEEMEEVIVQSLRYERLSQY